MTARTWVLVCAGVFGGCSGGATAPIDQGERELFEGPPTRGAYTSQLSGTDCVRWEGYKVTGSHKGGFGKCGGFMSFGPEDELRAVEVTVDVASMFSDNDMLTRHLLSPDFFEAERYAEAKYKSLAVMKLEDTSDAMRYEVYGAMTVKGTTQELTVEATLRREGDEWVGTAEFRLPRLAYGIAYMGRPDDEIKDEADVSVELRAPYDPKGIVAEELGQ